MTRDLIAGACPDPQMLSAYLDGKLDPTERGRIEDHISRCEDCYFVVRETALVWADAGTEETPPAGTERETPGGGEVVQATFGGDAVTPAAPAAVEVPAADPRRPKTSSFVRYFMPIAATLVVGMASVALWRIVAPTDPYAAAVKPLVEAVGKRRFFESRLTGGFEFGPILTQQRSAGSPASNDWKLLAAGGKVKEIATEKPTIENRVALAKARLLLGERAEAIELLQDLTKEAPKRADLRSDLAAAYLASAEVENRIDYLARALDEATLATELDPKSEEAWFNLTLSLLRLHLDSQALRAMEALRNLPGASKEWIAFLDAELKTVKDSRQQPVPVGPSALVLQFEVALSKWASGSEVREASDQARAAATTLCSRFGDCSFGLWLDQTLGPSLQSVAAAHAARQQAADYFAAKSLLDSNRVEEGLDLFERTQPALRKDTVIAQWAAFQKAIGDYRLGRTVEAERALQHVRAAAADKSALFLNARSLWMIGLVRVQGGALDAAEPAYAQSLAAFAALDDLAGQSAVNGLLSEVGRLRAEYNDAWRYRREGLRLVRHLPDRRRAQTVYLGATQLALEMSLPRTALATGEEAVPIAVSPVSGATAEALVYATRAAALAGRADAAALADLAEEQAKSLPAGAIQARILSDISATRMDYEGLLGLSPNDVEFALRVAASQGLTERLRDLHLAAASAYQAKGDTSKAHGHLGAAVQGVERRFGRALNSSDERRDWLVAERLLLWLPCDKAEQPLEELRALFGQESVAKPSDTILFIPSGRGIRRWSHLGGRWNCAEVGNRETVRAATDRLLNGLAQPGDDCHLDLDASRQIMTSLLDGITRDVRAAGSITLVPFRELARVPFSALVDQSDVPLIHTSAITVVSVLSIVSQTAPQRGPEGAPFLVLSDRSIPSSGGTIGAESGPIVDGLEATTLNWSAMTSEALLARLSPAGTVHVAMHGRFNPVHPENSAVLSTEGRVLLTAGQVSRAEFARRPLVVLASCDGGIADITLGFQSLGLVEAFLKAGSSAVIASLGRVDDAATASLMVHFYRQPGVPFGRHPSQRLRAAQLALWQSQSARAWASTLLFQTWG